MKYLTIFVICFALNFCNVKQLMGQATYGTSEQVLINIESDIESKYGQKYAIVAYNVDSLIISKKSKLSKGVSDIGESLSNSYIFLAFSVVQDDGSYPKSFIGVYKNGNIGWSSDRLINTITLTGTELISIRDINKDGNPEIITSWYTSMSGSNVELWIFSWNGTIGQL